jgi:hypothetical protein
VGGGGVGGAGGGGVIPLYALRLAQCVVVLAIDPCDCDVLAIFLHVDRQICPHGDKLLAVNAPRGEKLDKCPSDTTPRRAHVPMCADEHEHE